MAYDGETYSAVFVLRELLPRIERLVPPEIKTIQSAVNYACRIFCEMKEAELGIPSPQVQSITKPAEVKPQGKVPL